MKTFWIRTASAVVYALLFLGTLFSGRLTGNTLLGSLLFAAFLLFVTVGCSYEFFRMVGMQGARPARVLGYVYAIGLLLMIAVSPLLSPMSSFMVSASTIILFPCLFALAAIVQLWGHSEQPFREAAYTMVPLLYVAIPLALMLTLLSDHGAMVVFLIIALVWINDSGAYIGGSLCGKHKMWVRHSPGKTWEGTAIGVAVTIVLAVVVGPLLSDFAWYHWMAIGVICSVVDTLGDLVESMLKRSVGMKDSGNIMPGHGGFLDRFDSMLIIMPFVYAYITLII